MASESSLPSTAQQPAANQPGAIVVSETDPADLRKGADRRVLLRLWRRTRAGGSMQRRY